MKYDDAEYYFLNFETDLPNENGGRHIGLFLEWAILRDLASAELTEHASKLRSGETSGLELLFDQCDGKLLDDDLDDEGNGFAADYYEAHHLRDFVEAMNLRADAEIDAIFGADLTRQRRRRVLWQLDRRYSDWCRKAGLPNKEALLDRLAAVMGPAVEAVGFPRLPDDGWGSHEKRRSFVRQGECGEQRFDLLAVDSPEWFYGVRLKLTVDIPRLYDAMYAEKQEDIGIVTIVQYGASIPFERLAEGWSGPIDDYSRDKGFWIFRDEDIEPLAEWLAHRLRSFALPLLRGLDSIDALALAYGAKPPDSSPIHDPQDPYAALLSAEMARHPRLGAMLDETEKAVGAIDVSARTRLQHGALSLIARIRHRSPALIS
ncbi:MAG: hypothetical protein ABIR62_16850 [Dokdonella sp.]|uniref:DUF7832 domain-containing protein n=1 Tax=Dokdonella sp. TaxID=2291710 RepID=UPI0032661551